MQDSKERRLGAIECREAQPEEASGKMVIEGYASVFDTETLIGTEENGFYEKVARGAFDGADMSDVCLRYNHSDGFAILARTRNGSLVLTPDEKGLHVRAELLDTTDAVDMYKRIKAGLIDKMSFAFTVADEEVAEGDTPHRTIKRFDRLFDVSVVDTPAYDETSIYARSLQKAEAWRGALESEKKAREAEQLAVMKLRIDIRAKMEE